MDLTQTRGPWAQAFRVVPGLKRSARSLGSSVPHGPWAQAFRARGLCVLPSEEDIHTYAVGQPVQSVPAYFGGILRRSAPSRAACWTGFVTPPRKIHPYPAAQSLPARQGKIFLGPAWRNPPRQAGYTTRPPTKGSLVRN
ncbi:hypothetical protein PCANC_02224 [Puccinia coronata f. sp. avenae]|uniref:Uncharacterized protein n=1 Tax=Puccinia coronata f. sp. avenae TaxID=200324 RepID=A0A2N5W0S1_9BASI|nr:hypothetical protein PCANC_02224 [Puccinia coronata f. sp. avenae]